MLIWMCALHCEAKPIIDRYHLKKITQSNIFDCYQNNAVFCVVSGMGAINMAAATAWCAAQFAQNTSPVWINLGIAGHLDLDIGTTILASQVRQVGQNNRIYPITLTRTTMTRMPIESQQAENVEYDDKFIYDLEAFAFVKTASRFSPLEWCHCIKVISDNSSTPPTRDKARISELITRSMPAIDAFAQALLEIHTDHMQRTLTAHQLHRFLDLAHFSQTQRVQLKKSLLALLAYDPSLDTYHQSVSDFKQAHQILGSLERDLHRLSEQL